MTFLEAAKRILVLNKNLPMDSKDIWSEVSKLQLLDSVGKTPDATMYATLIRYCREHKSNKSGNVFFEMVGENPHRFKLIHYIPKTVSDSLVEFGFVTKDQLSRILRDDYGIEPIRYWLLGAYTSFDNDKNSDKTEWMVSNNLWMNGYEDKYQDEVKSINVGDKVVIKSVFRKGDKSVMRIKAQGRVKKNIGDGRTIDVEWNKSFKSFDVDFTGGYWSTVTNVRDESHISKIFKSR
jgi:hypothetical protein